jgi:anti-sigma factor RsiW
MKHPNESPNSRATRYIGGFMPQAERDAFESHYFSCQECAAEVKIAAMFVANLKAIETLEPRIAPIESGGSIIV